MFRRIRRRRRDTGTGRRANDTSGSPDTQGHKKRPTRDGWVPGDKIDLQMLSALWRGHPRGRVVVELLPRAAMRVGFHVDNEGVDVDPLVARELLKVLLWSRAYRWAALVFKGGQVRGVHPKVEETGAYIPDDAYDEWGTPTRLKVCVFGREEEVEVGEGEFVIIPSTLIGNMSWMGDSVLYPVYNLMKAQERIVEQYTWHAGLHGTGLWDITAETAADETEAETIAGQFGDTVGTGKYVHDPTISVDFLHPQQGAYDPVPMLSYVDGMVAGYAGLTKHVLDGSAEGYLSSSEVGLSMFYARVKELQEELLPFLKPAFPQLGIPEGALFADPTQMPQEVQAGLLRDLVGLLASQGVPPDEIIEYINRTLGEEFTVDEERLRQREEAMLGSPGDKSESPKDKEKDKKDKEKAKK